MIGAAKNKDFLMRMLHRGLNYPIYMSKSERVDWCFLVIIPKGIFSKLIFEGLKSISWP